MGLFSPIWMTKKYQDQKKAIEAVRKISDPDKLYKIAVNAPLDEVGTAAVEGIRDEALLGQLAMSVSKGERGESFDVFQQRMRDQRVAVAAVKKIQNRVLRGQIALSSKNEDVRRAAIEGIEDQALLAKLALESDNEYVADDAARKIRDPEMALWVAMSNRKCARLCAYTVSDPDAIRRIATSAPSPEARYAAVTHLSDADTLITVLEQEPIRNRNTRKQAYFRLRIDCKEKEPFTEEQRQRLVRLYIREPEDDGYSESVLDAVLFDDPEELRKIALEAKRIDLRMGALGWLSSKVEGEDLLQIYKDAGEVARSLPNLGQRKSCRDVQNRIENRMVSDEKVTPELLMRFIHDKEIDCNLASRCVKRLFEQKLDDYDGIEKLRDEAVATYIANIPNYGKDSSHNEKYCIMALAPGLPPAARERYGFKVWGEEREDEDQFGRNTVNVTYVEWKGKLYSYP